MIREPARGKTGHRSIKGKSAGTLPRVAGGLTFFYGLIDLEESGVKETNKVVK